MRPRRSLFATDYIGQTISAYLVVVGEDGKDPERADELKWCTSVLALYFQTIEGNDKTNALKKQFEEAGSSRFINLEGSVPYLRSSIQRSEVSYDQLLGLFRQRRSTRWFLDEPVPRDVLDKAVLAALQSPSACNRQPFQFRIIDGPEVKQIASIPMGTSGYSGNIPVIVAVVGSLDAYFDERDRHVIYVDGALASMSFMLALETLGLASCPINWPDIEERERAMDKALDLKPWERPIMLMAVGKPDPTGGIPYSEKAPLSCMRRYQ
ncbi:nitroreductase [Terrimicrobium sacchariphilum]|uniref:Nitroreductase n=1 Tax=Terrimicrobium sacchariphilum TaxID=690879 RepID=A0A146GC10_TERSA|nr:nitroreductase family protein [Terrimicrobium sacchariphilum]GAT34900.1 nitroreductase [Terrimicrobium sacchariphilum]